MILLLLDVSWCVPMRWWEEMTTTGTSTCIKKTLLQEPSRIVRTSVPMMRSPSLHLKSPLLYIMTTLKKKPFQLFLYKLHLLSLLECCLVFYMAPVECQVWFGEWHRPLTLLTLMYGFCHLNINSFDTKTDKTLQ